MKEDRWGTRHDWEQEQAEARERQAHEDGRCDPKSCLYHQIEKQRGEESQGG